MESFENEITRPWPHPAAHATAAEELSWPAAPGSKDIVWAVTPFGGIAVNVSLLKSVYRRVKGRLASLAAY